MCNTFLKYLLLATSISSLENYLFISLTHLLTASLGVKIFSYFSMLDISPQRQRFIHSVAYMLGLLKISFTVEKLLNFIINLIILPQYLLNTLHNVCFIKSSQSWGILLLSLLLLEVL